MTRPILSAAVIAGMLALAGCGGGEKAQPGGEMGQPTGGAETGGMDTGAAATGTGATMPGAGATGTAGTGMDTTRMGTPQDTTRY